MCGDQNIMHNINYNHNVYWNNESNVDSIRPTMSIMIEAM